MIPEVDDALRALLREEALADSDVELVLDAPTTEWAARRNAPTVNLYLYDIREDLRWRERGFVDQVENGKVVGRRPAPRLFKLSYLVTAWTQRPEDEHRLLDTVLRAVLRYSALPPSLLSGTLATSRYRPILTAGLPPPEDRGFADVWSSLGGQLKPSIDLVVTAPLEAEPIEAAPLAAAGASVEMHDTDSGASDGQRTRHTPPDKRATR